MENSKAPFIRVGSFIIIVLLLLYLPTREFLKMTFMLGMPLVLFLVVMKKNNKYSPLWIMSALVIILITGVYVYSLTTLPERIETRRIVIEGEVLLADGKFDEAVANYRKLEQTGEINKMNDKIAVVEAEKAGRSLIEEAELLIADGKNDAAREVLQKVPTDTRAAQEAVKMLRALNK